MAQKTFLLVAGATFSLVALAHLARLVFKWSVLLGGWTVPFWASAVALLVSAFLAYEGFRLSKKPS